MDDDIGAMLKRPQQDRRGDGVVDDEGDAMLVRDLGQPLEIAYVSSGIPNTLAKQRTRLAIDESLERVRLVALSESRADPELREDVRKQRMSCTVELWDRNDVLTGAGYVKDGVMQGRLPGTYAERPDPALQRSNAALEHIVRRVADPPVTMPLDFEIFLCMTLLRPVSTLFPYTTLTRRPRARSI